MRGGLGYREPIYIPAFRVSGKHPFIDLVEHLLDLPAAQFRSHHLDGRRFPESLLRFRKPTARLLGIAKDLESQFVESRNPRQPVRLVQIERFLPLAAVLQRTGRNNDFKKVFELEAGID